MKKKIFVSFVLCIHFYSFGQAGTFNGPINLSGYRMVFVNQGQAPTEGAIVAQLDPKLAPSEVISGSGISTTINSSNMNINLIGTGVFANAVTINTTRTWVCPPNTTIIRVTIVGAGGAGGDAYGGTPASYHGSGAGGNSGEVITKDLNVVPGTTYNIVVGPGGVNSTVYDGGRDGNNGSPSSFSGPGIPAIVALGGAGGGAARNYSPIVSAGAPSATPCYNRGTPGTRINGAANIITPQGSGGLGYRAFDGFIYGSGGTGGGCFDLGYPGLNGSQGVVMIEY